MKIDPQPWTYDQPFLSPWELETRGRPGPGPDFRRYADADGGLEALRGRLKLKDYDGPEGKRKLQEEIASREPAFRVTVDDEYRRALYEGNYALNIEYRGKHYPDVPFVRGGLWGATASGPMPHARSDVMIIGKLPGKAEVHNDRNFCGPSSVDLLRACKKCGIPEAEYTRWYMANLVRFDRPDEGSGTLPKPWIADCLPLLWQELIILRPKHILCLGSESIKALMGTSYNVSNMVGRMLPLTYRAAPSGRDWSTYEELEEHTATVMCVVHPAYVYREPAAFDDLAHGIGQFYELCRGRVEPVADETGVRHMAVYSEATLAQVVGAIRSRPGNLTVAFDAEWHGRHCDDDGAYIRTIQFAPAWKEAYCVVLTDVGGASVFRPSAAAAIAQLRRLVAPKLDGMVRVGGHAFRADMPWLIKAGLDLRPFFDVPEDWGPEVMPAGFDTLYMAHAAHESLESFKLENLAMRHTSCPRWDVRLQAWKDDYCKRNGLKDRDLEGYGMCPEDILHPYACLHGDSLVQLVDGNWEKISSLVSRRYTGLVRAFVDGQVTGCRVIGWHRRDVGQKEWFRLQTVGGHRGRWGLLGPILTPDHEVYTHRGKVRVDAINPGFDAILTEEREFSDEQLSVFLGSLLGDGGYIRRNDVGVGFGFSQRPAAAGYADWKAAVFSTHSPELQLRKNGFRRYHLPFGRYIASLARRFQAKSQVNHFNRKGRITQDVLDCLGDLGLAVWYQDDGSLITDKRYGNKSSRIYCLIAPEEEDLVVAWLTRKFGSGVRYNRRCGFLQISRSAFSSFQDAISPYLHPVMAYKGTAPEHVSYEVDKVGRSYYDPIVAVVPYEPAVSRRGHGVRYCLTVETAHNFLTKAGFVANCYDVDATRRLVDIFWDHCVEDRFHTDPTTGRGLDSRPAYLNSMQAWLGFLEMEMVGIAVDVERAETLIALYAEKTAQLKDYIRQVLNWPDFNPRSAPQCRELLFGAALNGTVDKKTGEPRVLRPAGAMAPLDMTPLKATTKPPKQWAQVVADGTWGQYTPSTDKETLGILAHDNEIVRMLCDIRFIGQVVNTVLRPPRPVKQDGEQKKTSRARVKPIVDNQRRLTSGDGRAGRAIELDDDFGPPPGLPDDEEEGESVYDGGFLYYMDADGRVRTHIYAAETRRCTSSRPNCQCFAKQRDADYQRILGYRDERRGKEVAPYRDVFGGLCYKYPIRTICRAGPGCVLLEWDLKSAEIAMLAWEADDAVMINDVRRATLPEDHPDYIDLHVATAISAFRLDCPPTKQGLEDLGLIHLRTPAKNVRFGVPYGRSAGAIARQCREQGAPVTERDAQQLIDGWHTRYRKGSAFLSRCARRVQEPGWMAGPFLGYRRFPETYDREVLKNMEREAQNFCIQNGVADMISLAIYNLRRYRDANPSEGTFRLILQIHDALILEVPVEHVPWVFDHVLPLCVESVEIVPRDLDGQDNILQGRAPYHFDLDKEVYVNWGEKLSHGEERDDLIKAGLDPKYLPREKVSKK